MSAEIYVKNFKRFKAEMRADQKTEARQRTY